MATDAFAALADFGSRSGPVLIVLVGPNGAGKSTFYKRFLSGVKWPFVNADVLAKSLVDAGSPAGEETEILAAQLAEKRRQQLIEKRESFIAETVFFDPVGAKVRMLKEAQESGYEVVLVFVCVVSAELTALRVKTRVACGGHDVPKDRIAARYERMRKNVKAALPFVDLGLIVDNSSLDSPHRPVAVLAHGTVLKTYPPIPWWAAEVLLG